MNNPLSHGDVDALAEAWAEELPEVEPPGKKPRGGKKSAPAGWMPKGGPIAHAIWLAKLKYQLMHGERGTWKTNIALHKLIIEMYENPNNLGLLYVLIRGAATEGGAWEKLNTLNLPEWYDGIGLDFTEPRMDDMKNRYIFIGNRFGGWSRVVLKSMPYGGGIPQRIKGSEPGVIVFEELTDADDETYFTKPIQQLRRPGVKHPLYLGTCNPPPEGPDHWVFRKFWTEVLRDKYPELDDRELLGRALETPTFQEGDFAVWHVPMSENLSWDDRQKADYQKTIMVEARSDPTAVDRLIKGLWVRRPTGQGMFKEYFVEALHIKGNAVSGEGLMPIKGFPIIIGYDIGLVWSSVTFLQQIPIKVKVNGKDEIKLIWIVFDEIDHFRQKILYKNLAWEVILKMRFWREKVKYPFQAMHITDDSAINQWRPGGEGSYDAWHFEKEYNLEARRNGERPIRMIGSPKGAGSVSARVGLLQGKLYQEELFVSALCRTTWNMLMHLEADDKKPENPKKDASGLIHKFDSVTYPLLRFAMGGAQLLGLSRGQVAPSIIRCG